MFTDKRMMIDETTFEEYLFLYLSCKSEFINTFKTIITSINKELPQLTYNFCFVFNYR